MKTARSGSSMIAILMILATLSVCVVCSLEFTSVVSRNVERSNALRRGYEVGDGVLDYAFANWREICRAQTNIHQATSAFASIATPSAAHLPGVASFTVSRNGNPSTGAPYTVADYKVVATDQYWQPLTSTSATPPPQHGMTKGTQNYHYLASATVTVPAMTGKPVTLKMRRIFTKSLMSPWNYAIFYVDDLELHPGATMNVTGWVHTNAKLYTAKNTLTFQSKVSYGDDWSKSFKDGRPDPTPGPYYQANLPPFRDQGQQPFGLDATRIFNTTDTSANNDSYRELVEMPTTSSDPIAEARYYNQADVKVVVNNAGVPTYQKKDGTVISSTSTNDDLKLYQAISSAVSVGATITDKREGTTVRLVDVDVNILNRKLNPAVGDPGYDVNYIPPAFGGVIYISDQSASASVKRAVRLKNGATVRREAGLTVATDNGLYVQGDYNTGRTGSTEPPSNTGNPAIPVVGSYVRKPCAVVADAVMILSNNWSDSNSSSDLSARVATATTINTAIVSGIVHTVGSAYCGGAENFPRFLEKWSNIPVTYYGSMVELYASKQFNTPWKNTGSGPNVYEAPLRRWHFDPYFYTKPPPGTLELVSYTKGRWFVADE